MRMKTMKIGDSIKFPKSNSVYKITDTSLAMTELNVDGIPMWVFNTRLEDVSIVKVESDYPLGSVIRADIIEYGDPDRIAYSDTLLVKADEATESWYAPEESEWFAFRYLKNIRENHVT
jgi:hypothetical protein